MKCQYCEKPATFHITELTGDEPQELHFCEDHARVYLTQADEPEEPQNTTLAGVLANQLKVGQTAEDLARLDQQVCPVCEITFYEFRHAGRLGCPHDYIHFNDELEPLIINIPGVATLAYDATDIHGAVEHCGKTPKHGVQTAGHQTQLIQLRREMKEAIEQEAYERASEIRDEIRRIETQHET